MNILVVAAHPDDEVLGCGGAIARHAASGDRVFIAILGEGMMARATDTDNKKYQERKKRLRDSSLKAASILQAEEVTHFAFPDNRMDGVALLDVIKVVEECIKRYNPSVVYTHHRGDLNIDHAVVAQSVLTATRPLPGSVIQEVLAFEVLSSSEWNFSGGADAFRPNCFVGIDAFLDRKIEAMTAYDTEIVSYPHPRSMEAIRSLAKRRGSQSGLYAAEGFVVVRKISP